MKFDIQKLIAVVKTTAAAIVPNAPAAIAAGEAVLDFVKSVAPTLSNDEMGELEVALPDLLTKMNRDVDQAIADLGGA